MPKGGEERKDDDVAPLFVRDAIMREQESTELAVDGGWKRDHNGFARRGDGRLRCSLPGSGGRGAGELAFVTATPIATRRIIARFTHPLLNPASFAQTRPRSRSGGVAGQRSFSQPNRGL
jgi:hypothetical protein